MTPACGKHLSRTAPIYGSDSEKYMVLILTLGKRGISPTPKESFPQANMWF